jgi:hypothetical protein
MFEFFKNLKIKNLSNKYKQDSIKYTKQINDYIAYGNKTNWGTKPEDADPEDNRPEYVE